MLEVGCPFPDTPSQESNSFSAVSLTSDDTTTQNMDRERPSVVLGKTMAVSGQFEYGTKH